MGKRYHYKVDGKEFGPVSAASFANILREGGIDRSRIVFRSEGRTNWTRADKVKLEGTTDTKPEVDISSPTEPEPITIEPKPSIFKPVEAEVSAVTETPSSSLSPSVVPMSRGQGWAIIALLAAIVSSPIFAGMLPLRQWEYKIASPHDFSFDSTMEQLGKEGWELVTARRATDGGAGASYEMIFRRPKSVFASK